MRTSWSSGRHTGSSGSLVFSIVRGTSLSGGCKHPKQSEPNQNLENSTGGVEWTVRRARACLLLGAASGLAALAGQRALLGLLLSLKLGMHLAALVLVLNLRRQCRLRLLLPPAPPLALVARGRRRVGRMLLPLLLLRHHRRGLLQLAQRGFKRRRRRRLGLRDSRENAVSAGTLAAVTVRARHRW
jgi:hypothetical protein